MQLEEIKKLASLARIDMSEEEMVRIAKDFDSILAYVGQVQEAVKFLPPISPRQFLGEEILCNIMRDDVILNNKGEYTEKILNNAPNVENRFLKVKQIL